MRRPTFRRTAAGITATVLAATGAAVAVTPAGAAAPTAPTPLYRDTHHSFQERAADLVSRMTLSEKVGQLATNDAPAIPRLGVQKYTYWNEGQHGINRLGADTAEGGQGAVDDVHATSFPTNFASSMSWDPALVYQETTAISDEVRGFLDKSLFPDQQNNIGPDVDDYGALTFWAPTVNMDRDPRWGRTDEAFGEDPYLVEQMAGAYVNGYQGQTMSGRPMTPYLKVATTAKHFALNNVEANRNSGSSDTTDANVRDYYTRQFRSLTEDAHVAGIMTSYNAVNGTPSPADTYTANELLQRTYGFDGYTTSDCGAVNDVSTNHGWSPPGWGSTWTNPANGSSVPAVAGGQAFALRAGTNLNCTGDEATLANIQAALDAGALSEGVIDDALVHVFTIRMETGEFDPASKVAYTRITKDEIESPAHQQLARKVADESVVLLKNDAPAGARTPNLPVDVGAVRHVVVLGALAGTVTLGGYSGQPTHTTDVVQGITAAVHAADPDATITYDAAGTSTTTTDPVALSDATRAAIRSADLVLVVAGTNGSNAGEAHDRTTLALPGNQMSLISQVNDLGNPRTVLALQAGGPVTLEGTAAAKVPSILFSSYNGQAQGDALADVVFGKQNPAGHLNFTWFKDDSQLPEMTNYGLAPSQTDGLGRTYQYFTGKPTYPFGYGLSYASFRYSKVHVPSRSVDADATVPVTFDVTNTGSVAGATVAQLYVAPQFTVKGVEKPAKQLVGFQRTTELKPGRTQHVTLKVRLSDLSRWDEGSLREVVDGGAYAVQVGPDSATVAGSGKFTVKGRSTAPVEHVTVQPDQTEFQAGDTLDLTAKNPWIADDTDATKEEEHAEADHVVEAVRTDQSFVDLSRTHVIYASSDRDVATVDRRGKVTMRAPGAATISATVGGVRGSTPIVVTAPFEVQAPPYVKSGSTFTATTTLTNTGATPLRQVRTSLRAPDGWTTSAASPGTFSRVAPGAKVTTRWTVTVPADAPAGAETQLEGDVSFTGAAGPYSEDAIGQADVTTGANPLRATPVVTGTEPAAGELHVVLDNPSTSATRVTAVDWSLGDRTGTQQLDTTIAPLSSATVTVDVGAPELGATYALKVTSVVDGGERSAPLTGHVAFTPVVKKSLGDSWALADVQDGPSVELGDWGAAGSTDAPAGLGGKVWFDWDADHLYVTADVTDRSFSEPATGGDIWQGDSLQLAMTSGVPGSSASTTASSAEGHYEYGVALTPDGTQVYRWAAPTGQAAGPVTDAVAHVTRDDATGHTLYELALPWSDLTSVTPADGTVFSLSALLNATDDGARQGFLQWGGGIGPSKDVADLDMAQLMP